MTKTVLVAEKDQRSAHLLCEYIKRRGHEFILVADYQQIDEKMALFQPDLLLLRECEQMQQIVKRVSRLDEDMPILLISHKSRSKSSHHLVTDVLSLPLTLTKLHAQLYCNYLID